MLTLWAAVVARRMGFARDEALSLGKCLAGLNAQSKGRRLGIFRPSGGTARKARQQKRGETFFVELCGRPVPARLEGKRVRAVKSDRGVDPEPVESHLEDKFGEALADTEECMEALARSMPPSRLGEVAYELYVRFRPSIPAGKKGWGAKGVLSLDKIRRLARGPGH